MAHGLVDLQPKLRALQNDGAISFRATSGFVQRNGLFGDTRRVADEVERFDQFVTGELVLTSKARGVRTLLNFVPSKAHGDNPSARLHFDLMNAGTHRRSIKL